MGLLFHFNFKGETSHVESSELKHTRGVPACRRCVQGKPVLQGWVSSPADGDMGRDAIQWFRLRTGCMILSKALGFPGVY